MYPIVIFTILQVSYYILRCIFPDFFIGGINVAKNDDSIYPQVTMGLTNLYAYFLVYWYRETIKKCKEKNLFLFLILLYFLWDGYRWMEDGYSVSTLIMLMKTTSPYIMFYVLYLAYLNSPKITQKCLVVIAVSMTFHAAYLFFFQLEYEKSLDLAGIIDSNYGSMIASALVFPLLIRGRRFAVFLWLIMLLVVFYSGQRSAILMATLSIPVAWLCFKRTLKRLDVSILFVTAMLFSIPFFIKAYHNLEERTLLEEESKSYGSGRSKFYPVALKGYSEGSIVQVVFGRPQIKLMDIIKKKLGIRITSHNGFIDILFCYGLIGFVIYISVFANLFLRSKRIKKYASKYYYLYIYMVLAWLVQNLVTHGGLSPAYGFVFGYIFAKTYENEKRIKAKTCLSRIGTYKSEADK